MPVILNPRAKYQIHARNIKFAWMAAFCLERQLFSASSQLNCNTYCGCTGLSARSAAAFETCCRCIGSGCGGTCMCPGAKLKPPMFQDSFSSHWLFLVSTSEMTPSLTLDRQLVRSDVTASGSARLMPHAFRSPLQIYL